MRVLVRAPQQHASWLNQFPVQVFQGDILDYAAVLRGAQGAEIIVHAAGMFRFWGKDSQFRAVNVGGAEIILKASKAAGCERLIHISTVYLVGEPPKEIVIDETYPPNPVEPYQKSKLAAERLMLEQSDTPVIVLRPGAFYGPGGDYAFNRLFFRDPLRGLIMQLNQGRYIILPVFVPDVAKAIHTVFTRGATGEVYNICDDPISHREVYDIVCQEAKLRYPRLTLPDWTGLAASYLLEGVARLTQREPFYPLNLRSYVYNYWRVSHEKAARDLGFVPTPFADGVRQTIAWYRSIR